MFGVVDDEGDEDDGDGGGGGNGVGIEGRGDFSLRCFVFGVFG